MKKGFTLIELLAVIVILAIILLIVMPIVLRVISDARKGAFEASARGLIKTVENKYMKDSIGGDRSQKRYDFIDGAQSDGEPLEFSGRVPQSGSIISYEDGDTEMAITDGTWCVVKERSEKDITPAELYEGDCELPSEGGSGGSGGGEVANPYTETEIDDMIYNRGYIPIANATEFNQIRDNINNTFGAGTKWEGIYEGGYYQKKYIQVGNIDLSIYSNWAPIGMFEQSVYDGNVYTISNMTINSGAWSIGLFEDIYSGTELRNITLNNVVINATCTYCYVGALSGYADDTGIINAHLTDIEINMVADSGAYVGGMIGYVGRWRPYKLNKIVDSSISNLNLTGGDYIGGLVGYSENIIIDRTSCEGSVKSYDDEAFAAGGFVGFFSGYDSFSFIKNSYSKCSVFSTGMYAGGFYGLVYIDEDYLYHKLIENSYVAASVEATSVDYPAAGDFYANAISGELGYWGMDEEPVLSTYYDTAVTGRNGQKSGDSFISHHIFRTEYITKVTYPFISNTLSVTASHGLPNYHANNLGPREIYFERSPNCYYRENLGVVTAGSSTSWQTVMVSNPPLPSHSSNFFIYFNDIYSHWQADQYRLLVALDGTITVRRGSVDRTVTIDYCHMGSTKSASYQLDPDWYGYPKTTPEMKQQGTYVDWDFDNIWAISPTINDGYPYLQKSDAFAREKTEDVYHCYFFDSAYNIIVGYDEYSDIYSGCSTPSGVIPSEINGIPVHHIGYRAFRNIGLTSLTLPEGIKTIHENAFSGNTLNSVTIPNSVVSIGARSFHGSNVQNLTIGSNVKSFGEYSFYGNSISNLTFPEATESMGFLSFGNSSITNLTLPTNLKKIGRSAFRQNSLTSINLPTTLIEIGGNAFEENSIGTLTIPENIKVIGEGAFSKNSLNQINIPNNVTTLGTGAFQNNYITAGNAVIDNHLMGINGWQLAFRNNGPGQSVIISPTFLR